MIQNENFDKKVTLPREFKERMTVLLGDGEARRLFDSIEKKDAVKAFRINTIKTDALLFDGNDRLIDRTPADFPPNAFITSEPFPGSLACHHSGAIYMQDISAMSTVLAVEGIEGACVLDSCSAPGGKTTQLAAMVGESGIVVANEYDKKRCRILQGNVERMGAKNTVVCSLDTAVLAEIYPESFDLVLCDAPCSGEGMFRKNPRAVEEWSEENVKMCAERQREILSNVAVCVKEGGRLIYSTCTFSLEENEQNVAWFLGAHPAFELEDADAELVFHTADGICLDGCDIDMTKCRRIYPHRSLGEGQFVAVLRRKYSERSPKKKEKRSGCRAAEKKTDNAALAIARDFLAQNLSCGVSGKLIMLGNLIFISPDIELPPYNVLCAGVCIGEVQKGRIVPHHQLFSAFGNDFRLKILLRGDSAETKRYLCGEEIAADGHIEAADGNRSGWAAVLIDGCAVGGAKVSGGVAKNHYPKGLRN